MRQRVEARDLQAGDRLPITGRTVERVTLHVPGNSAKVEVKLEGEDRSRLWGRTRRSS